MSTPGEVLPANLDTPLSGQSTAQSTRRIWPLLISGLVALGAVAALTLFGSRPVEPRRRR